MSAQEWEKDWWGDCCNTFSEENKQITYAHRMGLVNEPQIGRWPVYDLGGRSVLDLGGGPVSLLLKCANRGKCVVVDPCPYPEWVTSRYEVASIEQAQVNAEDFVSLQVFDEAWCYNVLQHVLGPRSVIETALHHAKLLRIFEWVETETNVGHPHTLRVHELNDWIGGNGTVELINENGAVGLAYHGVFSLKSDHQRRVESDLAYYATLPLGAAGLIGHV